MKKRSINWLIWSLILLMIDQLTKIAAASCLKGTNGIILIPGVFQLYYVENTGAAFGMLGGQLWLFIVFALLASVCCCVIYAISPAESRYNPLRIVCCLMAAGAIGNMIDRIVHHYVIDFLYFSLIDFPVFNVADIYVCCGAGLVIFLLLFIYRDDDFEWLKRLKK